MDSDAPYTGKAPEASSTLEEVREEIAVLVNEVRRENGLQELTIDQRLMAAAQNCSDQKFTWHHTKEECEAVAASGYPYGFGSNLTVFTGAAIADIAQRAVDNWEKSPGPVSYTHLIGSLPAPLWSRGRCATGTIRHGAYSHPHTRGTGLP